MQNETKKNTGWKRYLPHIITLGASLLIAAAVYPFLPDQIPMQFGFDGQVSRMGSRAEIFIVALIPALVYWSIRRKRS